MHRLIVWAVFLVVPASAMAAEAPSGLLCDLLPHTSEAAPIRDRQPEFTWIVPGREAGAQQQGYRIQVASLKEGGGKKIDRSVFATPTWDSGWVDSDKSVAVSYAGKPLKPGADYAWRVRVRLKGAGVSDWSAAQRLHIASKQKLKGRYTQSRLPLASTFVPAREVKRKGKGQWFVDFGRAAFGTVRLHVSEPQAGKTLTVHLGEKRQGKASVDRKPGGTIRYRKATVTLKEGVHEYTVQIPPDKRNTGSRAIKLPDRFPTVMPFRYVEIHGPVGGLKAEHVEQMRVHYPFDDEAARFSSSSKTLDQIWDFCHYSIKATSFAGVYVDGDRERIPYEADAYINQLCHYGVDRSYAMGRYSHEYLLYHPTWPTEWIIHSVLMAWEDYQYTGDLDSIRAHYETLKAKTLIGLARKDGLISTRDGGVPGDVKQAIHFGGKLRDIVDWPKGERDGYQFTDYNTVVNAFHLYSLRLMRDMAAAIDRPDDAAMFKARYEKTLASFQQAFFDEKRGVYTDGIKTDHASLHANMFPLAFGLVPEAHQASVTEFVRKQGMACSVYGAQYLVRVLYQQRQAQAALDLLRSKGKRSWWNMIRVGSTISLEAWDRQFKNNLDWNHAWGAAPANLIPRFLLGVRPLEPGFRRMLIAPQPASLDQARGQVPTIRGPVDVSYRVTDQGYQLTLQVPANTTAHVVLPDTQAAEKILHNGREVTVESAKPTTTVKPVQPGAHTFTVHHKADS